MTSSCNIKITPIRGNSQKLDGGSMFGNAPRVVWQKWLAPDEQHRVTLACRAMLVEVEGYRILCETGIGAFFPPKLRERFGVIESHHVLLSELSRLGIGEDEIDAIILSHLHFDHAGGLLPAFEESQDRPDRLLFPNARYFVGELAWARALNPHPRDRASFIPELMPLMEASGRLQVIQGEKSLMGLPDCISFRFSEGHTPGQMHTVVRSDKQSVIFAGDLIEEKETLYKDVLKENSWLFYCHDPVVAMSRIERTSEGRYRPIDELGDQETLSLQ